MMTRHRSIQSSWFFAVGLMLATAACGVEAEDADVAVIEEEAKAPRCTNGQTRCLDGNTPQLCVSRNWVSQADCTGDEPICSGGTCECADGAAQCTDGVARVCVNGSWESETCDLGCQGTGCAVDTGTVSVAGVVTCNPSTGLTCEAPTPYCDVQNWYTTFVCTAAPGGSSLACDGPNDCPAGYDCCKGDYALCGTTCRPAGTCGSTQCFVGTPDFALCDPAAPSCPAGKTCQQVPWANDVPLFGCK